MSDYLNQSFYYDQYGIRDELSGLMGNCTERSIYFILKNKYKDINFNPYEVFLNDMTFSLKLFDASNIHTFRIHNNFSSVKKNIFQYDSIELFNKEEAKKTLEGLLDRGHIVLIRTIFELLPFSAWYGDLYGLDGYRKGGHGFLIVGYDNNNYYYVDDPASLNMSKFISHKNRKDIGVSPKSDFFNAFNTFLKCSTVRNINTSNLYLNRDLFKSIVEESINNYNNIQITSGTNQGKKIKILNGRRAIEQLIKICESESYYLNEKQRKTEGSNLFNNICPSLTFVCNRRILFSNYINSNKLYSFNNVSSLDKLLKESITSWATVKNVITKYYAKDRYILDKHIGKYFLKILDVENQIFEQLKEFCKM